MKILRTFYVKHTMVPGGRGKFEKSQDYRDFPDATTDTEAKAALEEELGAYHDGSWKARHGFVDGFVYQRMDKPAPDQEKREQGPITEVQRWAETEALFSGPEMFAAQSRKPESKLP